ncbi:hypothetical protein [Cerasicoccus maritimus]|uniref:hypothetical protein n=1 Tax=Cerasicoccus maritimus TaxID=490089 RepID=UPI0028526E21|nr:hypothetical protein [Cerasicoccus maritimus]
MKVLIVALLCLSTTTLSHAGKHLYGYGNWIRNGELENGRLITIDFGDGFQVDQGTNIGVPHKENFSLFRVYGPLEDIDASCDKVPKGDNSWSILPKPEGTAINAVYVIHGKEQEFHDTVCVPNERDYEHYEKIGTPLTAESIDKHSICYAGKRVQIYLAKVGKYWVGVYR